MSDRADRLLVASAVGVVSGATTPPTVPALVVANGLVSASSLVEVVALVGGMAAQVFTPMPSIWADGVVDGAASLLGRRLTLHLLGKPTAPEPWFPPPVWV